MKVRRVIFTPVIENGKHAYRECEEGEWYGWYDGYALWDLETRSKCKSQIYTRTEEEVEIDVKEPHYQWAYKFPKGDNWWITQKFFKHEAELFEKVPSLQSYGTTIKRLDFTMRLI